MKLAYLGKLADAWLYFQALDARRRMRRSTKDENNRNILRSKNFRDMQAHYWKQK